MPALPALPAAPALPVSPEELLRLATGHLLDALAREARGLVVVDRDGRVAWMSEDYRRRMLASTLAAAVDAIGRPIQELSRASPLAAVLASGQAQLLAPAGTREAPLLACRIPLNDSDGVRVGALELLLAAPREFAGADPDGAPASTTSAASLPAPMSVSTPTATTPPAVASPAAWRRAARALSDDGAMARAGAADPAALQLPPMPTLSQRVTSLEREAIRDALLATGGNRVAAARRLRISRATLYERLAKYPELAETMPGRRGKA